MWHRSDEDGVEEFYLAGETVQPGVYRQIGGNREVCIEKEDMLPASLDGRVACYMRIRNLWSQIVSSRNLALQARVSPTEGP